MLFPLIAALVGFTLLYTGSADVAKSIPELPGLLVPQSTGKERPIVSMTKDASMYTERKRRSAIMAVHSCGSIYNNPIRESNITAGATNGYMEAYMLSSICNIRLPPFIPPPPPPPPPVIDEIIYTSDLPVDEYQDVFDGGAAGLDLVSSEQYYDSGDPLTVPVSVFDGIDPLANIMDIIYSQFSNDTPSLDAGGI